MPATRALWPLMQGVRQTLEPSTYTGMKKLLETITVFAFVSCISGKSFANRSVDNVISIHFAPEIEELVCNKVEETSEGEISKTSCLLKIKYVNENCSKMIDANFIDTVPDDEVKTVENEFIACRFINLMGHHYEFGMASKAQNQIQQ